MSRDYDLAERTARFGAAVIEFARSIPRSTVTRPLVSQLVRSGTSVGANYCEADEAGSNKDFCYRIGICRKEARETEYWLRMVVVAVSKLDAAAQPLRQEARELTLIFNAIGRSSDSTD